MNIVIRRLADLHPIEKNVRRHNEKQLMEYMRSLDKFKQLRPMVIDEHNTILVGNGMFEAMKRLGWETASCQLVEGLTKNEKTKLMLADNRIYELGMTDMDAFDEIIRSLGDDLDVPGWDDDLLQTLQASMAEANAMVESYGIFDENDVSRISGRQRVDHTQPMSPIASPAPLQQAGGTTQDEEHISARPELRDATASMGALSARTIVCPHCGEAITLASDLIGGV